MASRNRFEGVPRQRSKRISFIQLELFLDQHALDVERVIGWKVAQAVTCHVIFEDLHEVMAPPVFFACNRVCFQKVPRLGLNHGVAWQRMGPCHVLLIVPPSAACLALTFVNTSCGNELRLI